MKKLLLFTLFTVLVSFTIGCGNSSPQLSPEQIDSINKVKEDSIRRQDSIAHINDSISAVKAREAHIEKINDILAFSKVDNIADIQVFYQDIRTVKDAIESENDKALKGQWEKKLKAIQIKNFPKARQIWAANCKQEMWKQDVDVNFSGKTITFVGGIFAANANKQAAYEAIADALRDLRFKRCNFKWYKYDDNYTYWNISSKDDGEL